MLKIWIYCYPVGLRHSDSSGIQSDQLVCDEGMAAIFPGVLASGFDRVKIGELGRENVEQHPAQNSGET